MSPELIDPQYFGLNDSRPTKPSDCYALGIVTYETISGHPPFHEHATLTVPLKVSQGKRPPRGDGITDSLWMMLERCWAHQPNARPSIEDLLQYLEQSSRPLDSPYPVINKQVNERTVSSGVNSSFISSATSCGLSVFHPPAQCSSHRTIVCTSRVFGRFHHSRLDEFQVP